MQVQSNLHPLLACHLTVAFDLLFRCRGRSHAFPITQATVAYNLQHRAARKHGVETPIIEEVYAMLYEGKNIRQAVQDLTARESKAED